MRPRENVRVALECRLNEGVTAPVFNNSWRSRAVPSRADSVSCDIEFHIVHKMSLRVDRVPGVVRLVDSILVDVRLALRSLRRDRSFALTAIGTLALAISLNAIVFTVADAMLFRGYPHVRQNERLVYLQERSAAGLCCISYPDFEDWRAQARTFEAMAFVASNRQITFR